MKTIETVEFMCEYCGTKHARRDHAESCERNCYIQKMSNCELCIHYREHTHIKSPPTRFMRKILTTEQKWTESYCRCLRFFERWTQSRKIIPSWLCWGTKEKFKSKKLSLSKEYRNGLKGMSCPLFEEIK